MTGLLAALLLVTAPTAPAQPAAPAAAGAPAARGAPAPGASGARTLADPRALAARVQGFYERTRDLEAKFRQTYVYAGFGRRQVSSGTLRVKKPGMMRWDYESPAKKTIAVKGSLLVQYEPEENQAYLDEKFDASAMSAAVTFLLGKGDLAKEFDLDSDGAGGLLLRPKEPDPRVASIALTVGPQGEVTATRVTDGAGNVNEISFEDVRRNGGLPDSAFEVKLPKDVKRVQAPGR
jgi:outer membrane lipoprotein carrier protein